jgi:hypothetical protein
MRRTVILLLSLLLVAVVAVYIGTRSGGKTPGSTPTTFQGDASANPFGVFFPPGVFDIQERVRLAQDLGVKYFRSFPVLVPTWNGECPECQIVRDAGLKFVLTVRNSPDIMAPASPPSDLGAYKQTVEDILRQYQPALVVVENEEDTPTYWTASADEYVTELRAVCEVAHSMKIPCANGGLLSGAVTWLVYQHYLDAGQASAAQSFASRGLQSYQQSRLTSPDYSRMIADHELSFLKQYKDAGADYINIHWYVGNDQALGEAARIVSDLSGLPVISNEMGQRDVDPDSVVRLMDKVLELRMPFAVWFSSDGRIARSLVDPDGSLRPNGEAFRSVIRQVFK